MSESLPHFMLTTLQASHRPLYSVLLWSTQKGVFIGGGQRSHTRRKRMRLGLVRPTGIQGVNGLGFLDILLPVFLVVGLGASVRRRLGVQPLSLSRTAIYLLSPTLIFRSLWQAQFDTAELLGMALFSVILLASLGAIGFLIARLNGWTRELRAAYLLSILFPNAGNYGFPVLLFAYGQAGLDLGVAYIVAHSLLLFTVGPFLAASGRLSPRDSLRRMAAIPILWAAVLGLAAQHVSLVLPLPLARTVDLLAAAAIPVELLVLGTQLGAISPRSLGAFHWQAAFARLVLSPALGFGLVFLLGLQGLTARVLVAEC